MPHRVAERTAKPFIALDARSRGATDDNVRSAIAAFPGMLQRIDNWIEQGILGGEPPNAADLQIAPSLRLAMSLDDLRPAIEGRPAGDPDRQGLSREETGGAAAGVAGANHPSHGLSDLGCGRAVGVWPAAVPDAACDAVRARCLVGSC